MSTSTDTGQFLNSLQGRFIVASLLFLPLFIGGSGLLLEQAAKDNLLLAEKEQLQSQLYILLGSAEVQEGEFWLPEQLPEPRYSLIDSGLYAQIRSPNSPENKNAPPNLWQLQWQSPSSNLLNETLPSSPQRFSTNYQQLEKLESFFRQTYDLSWEDDNGESLPLRFEIFHSRAPYNQQLQQFRQQLWYGLSFLAMVLLTIQVIIMRWGLNPLKRLVRDIKNLSQQESQQLSGTYPDEITPITNSLNELLSSELQQRERYKNTLSDLAHSLKTPLAILQGELQHNDRNSTLMGEQVDRMDTIIRHQLQRAVIQSSHRHQTQIDILPVVERLCAAMEKVYRDKSLTFDIHIAPGTRYPIENQDLFELLGNLIENACKYGQDTVAISAASLTQSLIITVADNGAGIEATEQENILQRGSRADTAKPGQGIGLAVSTDIVSAYGGSIDVANSEKYGGAEFRIRLPIKTHHKT